MAVVAMPVGMLEARRLLTGIPLWEEVCCSEIVDGAGIELDE